MPQVGVNDEPLLERLMFGYDGSDYRVVKVDTSGNLVAAVLADQNVQARGYGWIGSAWQKQPLAWGFSGQVSQQVLDTNAAADNDTLTSTAVPAGEVWEIVSVSARDLTSAVTRILLYASLSGVNVYLAQLASPAANIFALWTGRVVLEEGDTLNAYFQGCTLNDDLYLNYGGVRLDIDQ